MLDYSGAYTKKRAQVRSQPINQTSKFILSRLRRMTNGSNLNGLPLILSQLNQVDRKLEPRGHTPLSCKKLVFKSLHINVSAFKHWNSLHVLVINNIENLDT